MIVELSRIVPGVFLIISAFAMLGQFSPILIAADILLGLVTVYSGFHKRNDDNDDLFPPRNPQKV